MRSCKESDLDLFFNENFTSISDKAFAKSNINGFHCFEDPGGYYLESSWAQQSHANVLHIDITRCKGDGCANSTEIDEFIEQHQIIMLRNEGRYDREEYDKDPIEKFTSLSAHTLAI